MEMSDVVETMEFSQWTGPFARDDQHRAVSALERGKVVFFPHLAFQIEAGEQRFLNQSTGDASRKNVSFDPANGRVHGTAVQGEELAALRGMIDRFGRQADEFVRRLFPPYAQRLERARTSFRPTEIAGRETTPRHDDRLLHVDAFPTRPLRGKRILRFFANVAPDGAKREWRVGEPFPDFAQKFMPKLKAPVPGQAWVMSSLGLTKGPRSAYDHYMLRLHDAGKLDPSYQTNAPKADVSFPPNTVWMCYTDSVLHAALSGRFAMEQTFYLPVSGMADQSHAPLRVLERITGRALV